MNEILILDEMPIILTKEKSWIHINEIKPGRIIFLPDDAVLVIAPKRIELKEQSMPKVSYK